MNSARPLLRLLLVAALFIAAFLAFTVLVFVIIEIALFVFVTSANYQFANNDAVFLVVFLLSVVSGLILTCILFLKESFLSPRLRMDRSQTTENDNVND